MPDTNGAAVAPSKDACCDCCFDLIEMRRQFGERYDRRSQLGDAVLNLSNLALQNATDNSNLASKTFLNNLTQPSLIEASAASDLKNSTAGQNAQSNTLVQGLAASISAIQAQMNAIAAALMNLANSTPSSPGSAREQSQMPPVVINNAPPKAA